MPQSPVVNARRMHLRRRSRPRADDAAGALCKCSADARAGARLGEWRWAGLGEADRGDTGMEGMEGLEVEVDEAGSVEGSAAGSAAVSEAGSVAGSEAGSLAALCSDYCTEQVEGAEGKVRDR